jgi:hypothetical protein
MERRRLCGGEMPGSKAQGTSDKPERRAGRKTLGMSYGKPKTQPLFAKAWESLRPHMVIWGASFAQTLHA